MLASAVLHLFPNRNFLLANLVQPISASSHAGVFEPMVVITAEQNSVPTSAAEGEDKLDSSEVVPSIFEEKESIGFNVADVIAQRVNDAYKAAGVKVERIARQILHKIVSSCVFPRLIMNFGTTCQEIPRRRILVYRMFSRTWFNKSAQPMV